MCRCLVNRTPSEALCWTLLAFLGGDGNCLPQGVLADRGLPRDLSGLWGAVLYQAGLGWASLCCALLCWASLCCAGLCWAGAGLGLGWAGLGCVELGRFAWDPGPPRLLAPAAPWAIALTQTVVSPGRCVKSAAKPPSSPAEVKAKVSCRGPPL